MIPMKFYTFAAILGGIVFAANLAVTVLTGDEKLVGSLLGFGLLYAFYLIIYFRRKKRLARQSPGQKTSPLAKKR